jgi:hypothetical protein
MQERRARNQFGFQGSAIVMRRILRDMCVLVLLLGCAAGLRADDPKPAPADQPNNAKRLLALHLGHAEEYEIFRNRNRREKLELQRNPVYVWTNPLRSGGQNGAVFVWTYKGRAEVVGSIFSYPVDGGRQMLHELHSLSSEILVPVRAGPKSWEPKAGFTLKPLPEAPPPADSARQRGFQLRALSRDFTAHSIDREQTTWQLRLLPQPLYRYESTDPKVIDGALFTFVTSAGTDPEAMIVLEARQTDKGPQWQYAVARFSDLNVFVEHKKVEVWKSVRGGADIWDNDPQHVYRLFYDRIVEEVVESDGS